MKKVAVLALITLLVVGCQSYYTRLIEAGYSEAYATGYQHGRERNSGGDVTLYNMPPITRDEDRYESDEEYRRGWDAGYAGKKW